MRPKDLDKQQRIKRAMVRLILREGMSGASVSKIAQEAGVSPATIYVYYTSKEAMLEEVFRECSHQSYSFMLRRIRPEMDGRELIDSLVRGYYAYTLEHEEVFSFVEQCSRCPTLAESFSEEECCCEVFSLLHAYQDRGKLKRVSDPILAALLFAPVRYLAMNRQKCAPEPELLLRELVSMLQGLLLTE